MTLFGSRIPVEVINTLKINLVKLGSSEWVLIHCDCVLIKWKFAHRHSQGEYHLNIKVKSEVTLL